MASSEPRAQHIRHCLLFLFDQGFTSTNAWKQLKKTYGNRTMSKSQCRRWFAKFESGDRVLYRLKQTNSSMNIPAPLHPNDRSTRQRVKQENDEEIAYIKEEPEIICIKEEPDIICIKDEIEII